MEASDHKRYHARAKIIVASQQLCHASLSLQHEEKFVDEFRVPETGASFILHGSRGMVMGERRLVGASGGQRVINVDHLKDSCEYRNILAFKFVRISGTVKVFVVAAD